MPNEKILVVEDERDILELITYNLAREQYQVRGVTSGEQAQRIFSEMKPDLAILDLMLPGMDGLDVCKWIKRKAPQTRVIILTAKGEESDVVTGLEVGADDYMTKPFSPRILNARVKANLRRGREDELVPESDGSLICNCIHIHAGKRQVKVNNELVNMTPMEFGIIHYLAIHQGWAYTRQQIVAAIRGEGFAVTDRSVDTAIVGLRKKLGDCSNYIETVRGVGYRFKEF